jgi:hypothetical protein
MAKFSVDLGVDERAEVIIEAKRVDVDSQGTLILFDETDMSIAFYPSGHWFGVRKVEPDKYAEATAAVS